MPTPSRTAHKTIANTALPYVTNSSVISTDPQYIGGQNVLTSLRGWTERRPGFSSAFDTTQFANVQRQFIWRRWSGTSPNAGAFVWMVSDLDGGVAKVYQKAIGVDTSAVLVWTSTSAEPFDFINSNNTCFFGNGTDMKATNSVTVRNWGITAPAAGPGITLVSGTANTYVSWCYLYTYYNASSGHESSPSPISVCSGVFASKNVRLSVTASADPQVTNIRIYRTTDGGAQDPTEMNEIGGSPFANSTTTHDDNTADANLSLRAAPAFLRNDPPTPSKGFVSYGGRIWGFQNNTTYYSGFEEIANGVPEESWPSGLDGNNYPWANEVTAHAPLLDGIAVLTPERIYKVEGDSLDTFRRYTLLERRGTRSRTAVATLGGSVAWLDTSNTVWISDMGEVGRDIRPDLANIDPTQCYLAVHISGTYHWLCVLDGASGRLFVYDLDRKAWMPPWTVGTTASALLSAESQVGVVQLLLARQTSKALALVSGSYTDDTSPYTAFVKSNMYRLTPDSNPSWKGNNDWLEMKTDAVVPTVQTLTDEDPSLDSLFETATGQDSPDIVQGTELKTTRYNPDFQTAQFMSFKVNWPAENRNFKLYQTDVAMHPVGE
jgi:hypothetical protein